MESYEEVEDTQQVGMERSHAPQTPDTSFPAGAVCRALRRAARSPS